MNRMTLLAKESRFRKETVVLTSGLLIMSMEN